FSAVKQISLITDVVSVPKSGDEKDLMTHLMMDLVLQNR
nr:hypothetical protein [Tanacetum cinerariifolium]